MTNKERLISLAGTDPANGALEGALMDAGINGSGAYDSSLSIPLKKCAVQVLQLLLTSPDTTTQDGMNIEKYDRQAVMNRIKLLQDEINGDQIAVPTIRGRSVW